MNFNEFIARFENPRKTTRGFVAKCPSHEDKQASLSMTEGSDGQILVKCFAGCTFDNIASALGLTAKDFFPEKNGASQTYRQQPAPRKLASPKPEAQGEPKTEYRIEREYSYCDMFGNEVYQALRLVPKSFRQRHRVNGKWVWTMDNVERVLYKLPEVIGANSVWILEGEKDVENMMALGYVATCNVGGAGKWLDGYTEMLEGKEVVLCGDNDKPGQEHIQKVFESIAGKVKSVKIIKVPSPHKDASDFIASFSNPQLAKAAFDEFLLDATPFVGGVKLPVYSMAEIEPRYKRLAQESASLCLDLSRWIPSFAGRIRPLIPGDFALFIAGTGVGKTACLQNIWMHSHPLTTLMFECELPEELLFERFLAMKQNTPARQVEESYRNNLETGTDILNHEFPRFLICPETGLTLERMEQIINKSELKMGAKIQIVLIDYVQLLVGTGSSRYERMSNIAEGLKVLAKKTKTIIVCCSQISRPEKRPAKQAEENKPSPEPSLHDAKDSGALENSSGLAVGMWRDPADAAILHLKVLKATKGGGGTRAKCNFHGDTMIINEAARVDDSDVPTGPPAQSDFDQFVDEQASMQN